MSFVATEISITILEAAYLPPKIHCTTFVSFKAISFNAYHKTLCVLDLAFTSNTIYLGFFKVFIIKSCRSVPVESVYSNDPSENR